MVITTFNPTQVSAAANPNHALNKTVTSSSSFEGDSWSVWYLTDGSRGTPSASGWSSWSNTNVNHSEWVKIDLGSDQTISSVVLCPRIDTGSVGEGFPIDFVIETSTDNLNWTIYRKWYGYHNPGSYCHSFEPPQGSGAFTARYVRITGTNLDTVAGLYLMQFAGIEVYNYLYPDPYDLALDKTVTYSSSDSSSGFSGPNMVDGVEVQNDNSKGWLSNGNTGTNHTEWVKIDMGTSNSNVSEIALYPLGNGDAFPKDFKIETSTDDINWTEVVRRSNLPNPGFCTQDFMFNQRTVRYVRITGTNLQNITSMGYRMGFAEVKVYNQAESPNTIGSTDYTMENIEGSSAPVIDRNHAGSFGNVYGYETGHVIKLANGEYHMLVTELYTTGFWAPTRVGHWKSTDGVNTWVRQGTIGPVPTDDWSPYKCVWDPQFYWNALTNRWNITLCSNGNYNGTQIRLQSNNTGDAGIGGSYSEVQNPFGLNHSPDAPYWMCIYGTPTFSNIFTVGSKLYTFICGHVSWTAGLASADSIEGPWSIYTNYKKPVFVNAENPIVTKLDDGTYFCVFDEINNGDKTIGYGYSLDGVNWIQKSCPVDVGWAATLDAVNSVRTPISLIKESDGTYTVLFMARSNSDNYFNVGKLKMRINKYSYSSTTLLADDFSGGFYKWEDMGSTYINNTRLVVAGQETIISKAGGTGWTNYTYQANVKINNTAAGLTFRIHDHNNYYMWQFHGGGNLVPHKRVDGQWTAIKTVPVSITTGKFYDVRIEANGSTIKTYINDALVDTTTDSTFTSGKVGFRECSGESAEFDNILVTNGTVSYTQTSRSSAVASSYYDSNSTAAKSIDSNTSTDWLSVNNSSQYGTEWLYLDMGSNQSVKRLKLYPKTVNGTAYCFPVDFKIQYSTDASNWYDVPGQSYSDHTGINAANQIFVFGAPVTARYIRVNGTKFSADSNGSYYMQLAEISADY